MCGLMMGEVRWPVCFATVKNSSGTRTPHTDTHTHTHRDRHTHTHTHTRTHTHTIHKQNKRTNRVWMKGSTCRTDLRLQAWQFSRLLSSLPSGPSEPGSGFRDVGCWEENRPFARKLCLEQGLMPKNPRHQNPETQSSTQNSLRNLLSFFLLLGLASCKEVGFRLANSYGRNDSR